MFLNIDQQLTRCERVIRQRVRPHIHPVVGHLRVEAFDNPGEPVPVHEVFARLAEGNVAFTPFTVGSLWGTTWGTVWFRLTGMVPKGLPANRPLELMVDLGWSDSFVGGHIEGMAYRPDGTAIKAVHPLNHWVPLMDTDGTQHVPIAEDGSFTVYLEAACNPFILSDPMFVETQLGECATGKPDEPYVFRSADLTEYDNRFEQYRADLEAVSGLMAHMADKRTARYYQLGKALQRSLNAFDEQQPDTVEEARQALAAVLGKPANASAMTVSAVGHAHIDSAWLWPVRETRRKVARTVSNVLALMDRDPELKYVMSSAQQYAWLKEDHPDLWRRMLERVKEGRFIPVGGMWVESDGNLPDGESLIRQISHGRRFFREELGVTPHGIWLPDSFGYTGAWPQIARRAGFDWFLTQKISWNDTTKFPYHSFEWEGLDGTRIFTHFPPSDTYSAEVKAQELIYTEHNFQNKDISDRALMLFGFGDGGGGPTREMLTSLRRFENLEGVPRVRMESPNEFFFAAHEQMKANAGAEMPVYKGELYLERHRGTLTSQQEMKRGCRTEESWLRTVEYLCAMAALDSAAGFKYPAEELEQIWNTLLLNQFHDILPGSGIAWVHREARADYERDLGRLKQIADKACEALRIAHPSIPVLAQARIAQYQDGGRSWLPASVPVGVVPMTSDRSDPSDAVETPAMAASPVAVERRADGGVHLVNGRLDVTIASDGSVSSLIDIAHHRELVASGMTLGSYELLRDEPSVWDAWDIERDALLMGSVIKGGSIVDVSHDDDGAVHVVSRVEFAGSAIDTTITVAPAACALDFAATVDWHERERFLKVDFPLAVRADRAQYDCQYGLMERPVVKNTAADEAQYENCTRRFAILRESDYAVAVVNGSIYGSDAAPIRSGISGGREAGTMFRLSLLSAPVFPDPHEDQGIHEFRWSVVSNATIDRTLAVAATCNAPVLHDVPVLEPPVRVETIDGTIVVDWMKLADDGSGDLIVRLYEAAGGRAKGRLRIGGSLAGMDGLHVRETDVCELDELAADLPVCLESRLAVPVDGAGISLNPFQLATLRINTGSPASGDTNR